MTIDEEIEEVKAKIRAETNHWTKNELTEKLALLWKKKFRRPNFRKPSSHT